MFSVCHVKKSPTLLKCLLNYSSYIQNTEKFWPKILGESIKKCCHELNINPQWQCFMYRQPHYDQKRKSISYYIYFCSLYLPLIELNLWPLAFHFMWSFCSV